MNSKNWDILFEIMKDLIPSTIHPKSSSKLTKVISSDFIKRSYSNSFNISIESYLNEVNEIGIYQCLKTGYRFYYPFNVDGDGEFYTSLEQFEWYYMPWKWEHEKSTAIIKRSDKILEVGSGGLGFLSKLHHLGYDISGLELNPSSVEKGKKNNLKVFNDTVQNHAVANSGAYDVVCSYQVLEHISNVHSFVQANIDCLKKGGKLIISVPNNGSFIRHSNGGVLNMPPHHMGLWDQNSLKKLTDVFDVELSQIYFEPLQDYHIDWYVKTVFTEKIRKYKLLWKPYKKLKINKILRYFVGVFKNKIKGHSIMAIYIKK